MKTTVNTSEEGQPGSPTRRRFLAGLTQIAFSVSAAGALAACGKKELPNENVVTNNEKLDIKRFGVEERVKVLYLSLYNSRSPSLWKEARDKDSGKAWTQMGIMKGDQAYIFRYYLTENPNYMEILIAQGNNEPTLYLRFFEDGKFEGHEGYMPLLDLADNLRKIPVYGV